MTSLSVAFLQVNRCGIFCVSPHDESCFWRGTPCAVVVFAAPDYEEPNFCKALRAGHHSAIPDECRAEWALATLTPPEQDADSQPSLVPCHCNRLGFLPVAGNCRSRSHAKVAIRSLRRRPVGSVQAAAIRARRNRWRASAHRREIMASPAVASRIMPRCLHGLQGRYMSSFAALHPLCGRNRAGRIAFGISFGASRQVLRHGTISEPYREADGPASDKATEAGPARTAALPLKKDLHSD